MKLIFIAFIFPPVIRKPGKSQTTILKFRYLYTMDYKQHIEINPTIRFGKPCIKGTRISVYDVLGWLSTGMTKEEIASDYPGVTEEKILACLAYSADKERKVKVVT